MTAFPESRQKHMWRCERCQRVLGELVESSVIIEAAGHRLYIAPLTERAAVEARCKCGHMNEMTPGRAAEERAA